MAFARLYRTGRGTVRRLLVRRGGNCVPEGNNAAKRDTAQLRVTYTLHCRRRVVYSARPLFPRPRAWYCQGQEQPWVEPRGPCLFFLGETMRIDEMMTK